MDLHYRQFKHGEALFILHGLYGSSDNWLSIAKEIKGSYNIVIPDLRNHGRSPHSPEHNYSVMAEDIKKLADSLQLKEINIVGHSMGGKLAMQFACMYPELTKRIIVVDIAPKDYNCKEFQHHINSHKSIIEQMLDYNFEGKKTRTEIERDFSANIKDKSTLSFILKNTKRSKGEFMWKINIGSIHRNLKNIMGNDLNSKKIFTKPTLFIKAEHSDYISTEDMEVIQKTFPEAQFVTIADSSHWIHTDQPHLLTEEINKFLK